MIPEPVEEIGTQRIESEIERHFKIRREMRAAFYPDTKEWKRKVWKTAKDVVKSALEALE